jgi:hypothetical protein
MTNGASVPIEMALYKYAADREVKDGMLFFRGQFGGRMAASNLRGG